MPIPVLDEMLDDPRNAARSPRSNLFRTTTALIGAVILLIVLAIGAKYAANNWREIIYGKTAAITNVTPEDGLPVMGNDMARTRGALPLFANEVA